MPVGPLSILSGCSPCSMASEVLLLSNRLTQSVRLFVDAYKALPTGSRTALPVGPLSSLSGCSCAPCSMASEVLLLSNRLTQNVRLFVDAYKALPTGSRTALPVGPLSSLSGCSLCSVPFRPPPELLRKHLGVKEIHRMSYNTNETVQGAKFIVIFLSFV